MSKDTDKLAEDSIYSANNETGLKIDRSRNTNDSKNQQVDSVDELFDPSAAQNSDTTPSGQFSKSALK